MEDPRFAVGAAAAASASSASCATTNKSSTDSLGLNGLNLDDEGNCHFVVNSVLSSLDDDEDDPELAPPPRRFPGGVGGGAGSVVIGQIPSSSTATPSVDSGFGGGASPPPSAGLDSASGGGSPSPCTGTPTTGVCGGAPKFTGLTSASPTTVATTSSCSDKYDVPSFKVPNLHAIEGTSLFDDVQLSKPPAAEITDNHQAFDIATLEQAINVIKIGMTMPTATANNPVMAPAGGDSQNPFNPQTSGSLFSVGPGGDQPESNLAQNLMRLASIQDQMASTPPQDRYSFPPSFNNQLDFDGGYGFGGRQCNQGPPSSHMRMMKQQHVLQMQHPRHQHQQLQRYHSNEGEYGRGGAAVGNGFGTRYGSTSPFNQQQMDFMQRQPERFNFRGSNNSLNDIGQWLQPGGGQPSSSSSSTSGGGNGNMMLDSLGISNMSRLEINKGGLGKNPYASLVSTLSSFQSNPMQIRCKFGQLGQGQGQFNSPHGFCLGRKEEIVVADTHNHRIQIFDTAGNFKFMFGNQGKAEGCLWYPRKVAVLKHNGNFVVCDRGGERSRMQIFNQYGQFSHAISIRFIDIVAGLAITHDNHIVAVDSVTPTIFILSEEGKLLRYHECSEFMKEPSDIGIFDRKYYICDFKDHNVVVVSEEGRLLRKIGSDRITCFPNGIDISDAGDVLVGDSHGNKFHVAVFDKDHGLASQFECPNVKVSRCCGLKITSEGYIVTLAKNNHHVLVLNTIYLP